jgi:hypothetical protein
MDFEGLEALQRRLRELKHLQSKSLATYFKVTPKGVGFRHLLEPVAPSENSKGYSHASTATCIVSLVNTGAWRHEQEKIASGARWSEYSEPILRQFCKTPPETWQSADLPSGNAFTVAFTLEGIKALQGFAKDQQLQGIVEGTIKTAEAHLMQMLSAIPTSPVTPNQYSEIGAAHIDYYPPTTFLTQLVVRSMGDSLRSDKAMLKRVEDWCRKKIEHELALLGTPSNSRDPLALSYAITAFLSVADTDNLSPNDVTIINRAVDCFFLAQLEDGSWPRSKPLHHYPNFGNAYCHEYETLAQLLTAPRIEANLIGHLEKLERCISALDKNANNLPNGGKAWPSGHHPHIPGAESWSTAAVFEFVHCLDRLVAEAIRKNVFKFVGSTYEAPKEHKIDTDEFNPTEFLDSAFVMDGKQTSLRRTVQDELLRPILRNIGELKRGEKLSRNTPIAAILFGPPGTSKTQLAKLIAKHLGWPRLDIDPSHLFRSGLENIQSESNRIFNMLAVLERTVVFFDEFDELTRERTSERSDMISRFLTTAMLPKLSRIADQRKIVFLLATNHIEDFDFAISRPGRFDMLLPVMPPSLSEKFRWPHWSGFKEKVETILEEKIGPKGLKGRMTVGKILEALTYDEFGALFNVTKDADAKDIKSAIVNAWRKSTLAKPRKSPSDKSKTLLDFYHSQSMRFARLPPPASSSRDVK